MMRHMSHLVACKTSADELCEQTKSQCVVLESCGRQEHVLLQTDTTRRKRRAACPRRDPPGLMRTNRIKQNTYLFRVTK